MGRLGTGRNRKARSRLMCLGNCKNVWGKKGIVSDEAEEEARDQPFMGFMLWAMRRNQGFILS